MSAELAQRFLSHTQETESGCVEWTAARTKAGYGHWYVLGKNSWAHRLSYELFVGPIPEGFHIDHLCRNTCCVLPAHLEPVTPAENNRRGNSPTAINKRKTHCIRGHAFDAENTYWTPRGRHCRKCKRREYEIRVRGVEDSVRMAGSNS